MVLRFKMASDARDPEKTRWYTKSGRLTPYAFACGYVERYETDERTDEYVGCLGIKTSSARIEVRLYKEFSHYQVSYVEYDQKGVIVENDHCAEDTLTMARRIVTTCRVRASCRDV